MIGLMSLAVATTKPQLTRSTATGSGHFSELDVYGGQRQVEGPAERTQGENAASLYDTAEEEPRRILVVGATGLQGGAVCRHLLLGNEGRFSVYGMTRYPSSARARALERAGVTVVQGDLDDPGSIDGALAIASGAMPGKKGIVKQLYGGAHAFLPPPTHPPSYPPAKFSWGL
eukprot:COSAG01_NODE_12848_length_1676_cov_1.190869_1_plen_173_part_00